MIWLASAGIARAMSRRAGTPVSTTGSRCGSWQNRRNIGRARTANTTPIAVITPHPMANAVHPDAAARPGSLAPRLCPTIVIAAVPNAAPARNPSASHWRVMPWAAAATSPRPLTMLRNHSWHAATLRLSTPAGTLTRRTR